MKKLAYAALTAMMSVSAFAAPVLANTDEPETPAPAPKTGTIKKVIELAHNDRNLTLPEGTSFSFAIAPTTTYANADGTQGKDVVCNGVAGGVDAVVTAAVADDYATPQIEVNAATVNVYPDQFPAAGTYAYTVTEKDFSVNGVSKKDPNASYELRVYIFRGENNELVNGGVVFFKDGVKQSDPSFTNTYDADPLMVKKVVTGNQGDKNETFPFTITINGKAGQTFTMAGQAPQRVVDDATPVVFNVSLKHDEEVTIHGLTADDTYTVTETNTKGYDASYTLTVNETTGESTKGASIENITAQNTGTERVTFTNDKTGTVLTGLVLSAAPYVVVGGLGTVFATMFFKKKREE